MDRPVAKILNVTEHMARGEFDTDFTLAHEWGEYDVFDFILENLSLTAEELKRGEQRRSDFVANVSHELKTPLAIVTNCADVLRQEGLSEERRREYAEILHAAAGRLSALVSNVLKLDKLENGSMPPEAKKFDLGESLAQCVLQFEDAAERKGLNFACEIEEGVELVSDESPIRISIRISSPMPSSSRMREAPSLSRCGGRRAAHASKCAIRAAA